MVAEGGKVVCQRCGCEVSCGEEFLLNGQVLCDDCYLEESSPVTGCNPLAVYSAKRFRKADGAEAEAGLTDQQRAIYIFIKSREKATLLELCGAFGLSLRELENQVAILRHLELTKGKKEDGKIYIVPF